jgi:hypothetical protein
VAIGIQQVLGESRRSRLALLHSGCAVDEPQVLDRRLAEG